MTVGVKVMEEKKAEKATTAITSRATAKKTESYLSEIKNEFSKITWTEKDELAFYTKLVVGATFISGVAVYIIDLSIRASLTSLETIVKFIFG